MLARSALCFALFFGGSNLTLADGSKLPPIREHLVESGIFVGDLSFSIDNGDFVAELLYDGKRRALVFRTVASRSGEPALVRAEERMPVLDRLLQAFFARNPPQPSYEFSVGYYPELSVRLAKMSAHSPEWSGSEGYLEGPTHVDALANWINKNDAASELQSVVAGVGYRVIAVATEKPIVLRWGACPLTRDFAQGEAKEHRKRILCSVSVYFKLIRE